LQEVPALSGSFDSSPDEHEERYGRQVAALIAGLPTSFEDPRQQVVYELTMACDVPSDAAGLDQ
jgi:hypothetical protein